MSGAPIKNVKWEIGKLEAKCGFQVSVARRTLRQSSRRVRQKRRHKLRQHRRIHHGKSEGQDAEAGLGTSSATGSEGSSSNGAASDPEASVAKSSGEAQEPLDAEGASTATDGDASAAGTGTMEEEKRQFLEQKKQLEQLRWQRVRQKLFHSAKELGRILKRTRGLVVQGLIKKRRKVAEDDAEGLAATDANIAGVKSASIADVLGLLVRRSNKKRVRKTMRQVKQGAADQGLLRGLALVEHVTEEVCEAIRQRQQQRRESDATLSEGVLQRIANKPAVRQALESMYTGLVQELELQMIIQSADAVQEQQKQKGKKRKRDPASTAAPGGGDSDEDPHGLFFEEDEFGNPLFVSSLAAAKQLEKGKKKKQKAAAAAAAEEKKKGAKPKKNRMSQRKRRELAEAKYGDKAKHLVAARAEQERAVKDKPWHRRAREREAQRSGGHRRGAQGGDWQKRKRQRTLPAGDAEEGPAKPTGTSHPSWEARKRQRLKIGSVNSVAAGAITFDDDDSDD